MNCKIFVQIPWANHGLAYILLIDYLGNPRVIFDQIVFAHSLHDCLCDTKPNVVISVKHKFTASNALQAILVLVLTMTLVTMMTSILACEIL